MKSTSLNLLLSMGWGNKNLILCRIIKCKGKGIFLISKFIFEEGVYFNPGIALKKIFPER